MTDAGASGVDARATRVRPRLSRRVALAAGLLLAVHALLIVLDARAMGRTTDEANYFNSARVILRHGWVHESTLFQGPLALYANQLFVGNEFPSGGLVDFARQHELALRGRLGTLPFALLGAVLVFLWARALFGDAGGLLALLLHALDPVLLGYSSLMLVDAQHAATSLLVLYVLWRYLEADSARRARGWIVALGVTLGLALATKYLAVLLALVVGATVGVRAAWPARGTGGRRVRGGHAAATLLALVACAFATLHAAYLFRGGFAGGDSAPRRSELVREVMEVPVLGHAVGLLPRPFLAGVDYQLGQSERGWRPFLNGEFAERQPATYAVALLCKTPEVALLCLVLALVLRARRFWRRSSEPGWHTAALATLPFALVLFAFLSLSPMQLGIRYVLPLLPLAFLAAGALAWRAEARPPGARFFGLLVVLGALHARELAGSWPDWISYFNSSSGGQALAFRRFRDTNNDFGQYRDEGPARLRARHGEFALLSAQSGARFGLLAVDNDALKFAAGAPRGLPLAWLTWLEPVDHLGASWWLFELTPEAFERRVEAHGEGGGAPELRRDLALAYLGAGRRTEAERHIARLSPDLAAPLQALIEAEDAARAPPERAPLQALIRAWLELARPDRALAVAEQHADVLGDCDEAALARVEALEERRDYTGAARALEREWSGRFRWRMRRLQNLRDAGDFEGAAAVLEDVKRHGDAESYSEALRSIQHQLELRTEFRRLLR